MALKKAKVQTEAEASKRGKARKAYAEKINKERTNKEYNDIKQFAKGLDLEYDEKGNLTAVNKNLYGKEMDLAKKVADKTANDREMARYEVYKKLRLNKLPDINEINTGLKDYYDEYENYLFQYREPKDYDDFIAKGNSIKKQIGAYVDFAELYGGEYASYKSLYDDFDLSIKGLEDTKKLAGNLGNAEEFKNYKRVEAYKINNYGDFVNKWYELYTEYEEAKKDGSSYGGAFNNKVHDILQRLSHLEKYGKSERVVATMSDKDWVNERTRANLAYAIMKEDYYSYTPLTADEFQEQKNEAYRTAHQYYLQFHPEVKGDINSDKYKDRRAKADEEALELMKLNTYGLNGDFEEYSKPNQEFLDEIKGKSENGGLSNFERAYWAVNSGGNYDPNIRSEGGLPVGLSSPEAQSRALINEDEVKIFNYLYNKFGEERANAYLNSLDVALSQRYLAKKAQDSYEFGKKHPYLSWGFNILEGTAQSMMSPVKNIENAIDSASGEVNPYELDNVADFAHSARIQGGAEHYDSKFGQMAYKAATSVGEMIGIMAASKGMAGGTKAVNKATSIINGMLNSSKTMYDTTMGYKTSGASDAAALGMGAIAGLIEFATEKWSMDQILKTPDILTNASTLKKIGAWSTKFARDFAVEGGEEVTSSMLNTLAAFLTNNRQNDDFLITFDSLKDKGKSNGEALIGAIKKVAPGYFEEFIIGGIAGGLFGSANTYATVKSADAVRQTSIDYFDINGTGLQSVQKLLIQNGVTGEAEIISIADGIMNMGQGKKTNSDTEAKIKENPFYRGVLYGYADVFDFNLRVAEKAENPSDNGIEKLKKDASSVFMESDSEFSTKNEGRAGRQVYFSEATEGEGGLVDTLIEDGFSKEDSMTIVNQMYTFMYEQGYKGRNMDVAINAVSENIMPGFDKTAEMFYAAGKIDAQNNMRGKKTAKLKNNMVLSDMYKNKEISHKTARAINAIASKLGVDIEFVDSIEGGHNALFNTKTGKLKISRQSKKPFVTAAIHESIHSIRSIDTKSYNKLSDIVYEVLSSNDEVNNKAWGEAYSLYKKEATDENGKLNRDYIDEELTAEVISQLLTDETFINELAKTNRNLVQKIFDVIADFFDKMTKRYTDTKNVMSAEMREALKELQGEFAGIKKMYLNALDSTEQKRGVTMTLPRKGEVMHSDNAITADDAKLIQSIGRKSINELTEEELAKLGVVAQKYWNSMSEETRIKSPFFRRWFGDWREFDKTSVNIVNLTNMTPTKKGTVSNNDSEFDINVSNVGIDHIQNHLHDSEFSKYIVSHLDEITRNAVLMDTEISEKSSNTKHDNTMLMHNFYSVVNFKGKKIIVKLFVEEFYNDWNKSIQRRDYDLSKIKTITDGNEVRENNLTPLDAFDDDSNITVSDLFKLVKWYDSEFKPVKCSAVLNEDGTPKKVYHGTKNFGFVTFDLNKSDDKSTIFLTDSPELASTYSGKEGITKNSDVKDFDYENLSPAELVSALNEMQDASDEYMKSRYFYVSSLFRKDLKHDVELNMKLLRRDINSIQTEGKEGIIKARENLIKALDSNNYRGISTPLYTLLHYSDVFRNHEYVSAYAELEKNSRLLAKLEMSGDSPKIVSSALDGYAFDIYELEKAKQLLYEKSKLGIYETYLNLKNPLIVNANGKPWNNIREWSDSLIPDIAELGLVNENDSYYLVNKNTGMHIPGAVVPETAATKQLGENQLISLLANEARNIWAIRTENVKNTRGIAKIAKIWKYDGVIIENVLDSGGYNDKYNDTQANIYIAFDANQIKSSDNLGTFSSWDNNIYHSKSPVAELETDDAPVPTKRQSATERNAASFELKKEIKKQLDKHIEKYGEMEKGVNPTRNVNLPKQTSDDRFVRRATRTVIESERVTDEIAESLAEEIANGEFWTTYERAGNQKAQDMAEFDLKTKGFDEMYKEWKYKIKSGAALEKQDVVNAQLLMEEASKKGDTDLVVDIVTDISAEATRAGQLVQSMLLLKRLGTAANVRKIQNVVKNLQQDLKKKFGKKTPVLEIPKDLLDEFAEVFESEHKAGDNDHSASDAIVDKIYEAVAKQVPTSWEMRFNTWRYFSMLGNFRTHIRNFFGNLVFQPAIFIKNLASATLEGTTAAAMKLAGKDMQRSKTLKGVMQGTFKQGAYKYAIDDAAKIESVLRGESRYNEVDKIMQKVEVYKTLKFLNSWVDTNSKALEAEDWFFLKRHYARALTMYMNANNLTADSITDKQLEIARKYAIKEAQRATFRDESAMASTLSLMSKRNKGLGIIVESLLPFKKTPINILKRGVEYSPIGIVKSLKQGFWDLRKGKITVAELIDGIGTNLTGTGILALGVYLASQGILKGPGDDDEENKFAELLGVQNYSIKLGDATYTIDWMSPAAMSLFVGCEMWRAIDDGSITFAEIGDALPKITEPLFDMSMLDGLTGILERASYVEGGAAMAAEIFLAVPANYVGQFLPTILGHGARTIDPVRRQTYIDKNSNMPQWLQSFMQQQMKKIPLLSDNLQPYINAKGETEVNAEGNIFARAVQNFFSPGYYKSIKSTEVDEEIMRLYDTQGEDAKKLIPKNMQKSIKVDGEDVHLSNEQYTTYQKTAGQTYYKKLKEVISSDYYKELTDSEKTALLGKVRDYSIEHAREKTLPEYHTGQSKLKTFMEIDGGYAFVLNENDETSKEADYVGDNYTKYEKARTETINTIMSQLDIDSSDAKFNSDYRDKLYEYVKEVNLEKYSDGKYKVEKAWVIHASAMSDKEKAEYIYGETVMAQYENSEEAKQAIYNDDKISDKVKMYVVSTSAAEKYNAYLGKYDVDPMTWMKARDLYDGMTTIVKNGKEISKKDQVISMLHSAPLNDAQKSAVYRALGYKDIDSKGKIIVKVPWKYNFDVTKSVNYRKRVGTMIADTRRYSNDAAKGQCVWYARGRAYEVLGKSIPAIGNANEMYGNAKENAKLEAKAENLKANVLVCYNKGTSAAGQSAGHVIYIEHVDGNAVYYTEGGYGSGNGTLKVTSKSNIINGINGNGGWIGREIIGIIDVTKY